MSKTWLYTLMFVVVILVIMELIPLFMGKPFYYESSKLLFEFSGPDATVTSTTAVYIKNAKKIKDIESSCSPDEKKLGEKEVKNLKSLFGENVEFRYLGCHSKKLSENEIQIKEIYYMKNLGKSDGNKVIIDFGKKVDKIPVNSKVVYIIPSDAKVLTANPTPTSENGNVLEWDFDAGKSMVFPKVEYQR